MRALSLAIPPGASAIVSKWSKKVLKSIAYLSRADHAPDTSISSPPAKMAIAKPPKAMSIPFSGSICFCFLRYVSRQLALSIIDEQSEYRGSIQDRCAAQIAPQVVSDCSKISPPMQHF